MTFLVTFMNFSICVCHINIVLIPNLWKTSFFSFKIRDSLAVQLGITKGSYIRIM